MTYALGKYAKAICDRCGFEYKLSALKEEWNGLKTCPECFELTIASCNRPGGFI